MKIMFVFYLIMCHVLLFLFFIQLQREKNLKTTVRNLVEIVQEQRRELIIRKEICDVGF